LTFNIVNYNEEIQIIDSTLMGSISQTGSITKIQA